jgi:S-DNA-T family DNA segregation ATPase FtsK/SpoIIIE
MLFFPVGASEPSRVQGVFVDDEEIKRVVDFLKKQPPPKPLVSIKDGEAVNDIPDFADTRDEYEDELYDEAVRTVVIAGQASQSMLQRKLRVGFARAGRLIDIMEQRGIVGPPVGTKARDVLISLDDLE